MLSGKAIKKTPPDLASLLALIGGRAVADQKGVEDLNGASIGTVYRLAPGSGAADMVAHWISQKQAVYLSENGVLLLALAPGQTLSNVAGFSDVSFYVISEPGGWPWYYWAGIAAGVLGGGWVLWHVGRRAG